MKEGSLQEKEAKLKAIQHAFEQGIDSCRELGMNESEIEVTFRLILNER